MNAQILSATVAIIGFMLYHVCQKELPEGANAAAVYVVAYVVGAAIALGLLWTLFRPAGDTIATFRSLGWPAYVLAVAVILVDVGLLYMYRAGWPISQAPVFVSVASSIVLVVVGVLRYGERVTAANFVGLALCLIGLVLLTRPASE